MAFGLNPNNVWAINFVHGKLSNGQSYRALPILDEFSWQTLPVTVRTKIAAYGFLEVRYPLRLRLGSPVYIRPLRARSGHLSETVRKSLYGGKQPLGTTNPLSRTRTTVFAGSRRSPKSRQ